MYQGKKPRLPYDKAESRSIEKASLPKKKRD